MRITFLGYKHLYKKVFGTEEGKQVLHDLCNRFYMMAPTVRDEELTEQKRLIREGMRQAALYILSQVNYDIDKYTNERDQYKLEIENK